MTLASGLLALLGFIVLIVLHELGHFVVAKRVGMRVERFALFFPPLAWRKQVGETEYALGTIPLGGYVRISGMNPSEDLPEDVRDRAYHAQSPWKRMAVIAAGPLVNILVAFVLLFAYAAVIGPRNSEKASATVDQIEEGFPAAETLEPGDRLVSVDGVRGGPVELSNAISRHRCAGEPVEGCRAQTPAQLEIERDGRTEKLAVRPLYDPERDRTRLGFSYLQDGPREPFAVGESFTRAGDQLWFMTKETVKLPARIIDSEQRKEIRGIVGSYETTRQVILDDIEDVIFIMAVISLSLAIINLFPFLPLDGGHIFWAIVEKVRRKPVPFAVMERAGVLGFFLVIGLFLIGLTNDIGRLSSGEGFEVR